ncbi:uncharacterized protein [Hoplias malabaricus]|uniref:uncharacterized protein n=1 Tax=Hoplias malabaricus TaxID=27720 RepID=UPI0034617B93
MWRYRQPDFALHLLRGLQKQQRAGVHCDTLLQTEGVSIPVHSCVLSALSPVFSRALTNFPALPIGHSRLVRLNAVCSRALLKLVGFIYSGEMEGEGLVEHKNVIDVAHRLGFGNLIDRLNVHEIEKAMRLRDVGLQTEGEKNDENVQILLENTNVTDSETQTDNPDAHLVCPVSDRSIYQLDKLASQPCELRTSTSAVGLDCIKCVTASSGLSGEPDPVHSKCCQQVQKERRQIPRNVGHLGKMCQRQTLIVDEVRSELLNSRVLDSVKQTGGKNFRKLVEKLGFQSSTGFKQQRETHISLKIKLKRIRREALWEIVSVQEETGADGSSASGSGDDRPGETHKHNEDCATLSQPQRHHPEVVLSFSPMYTHQNHGTITLTPPSDLTMSPPATPTNPIPEQSDPQATDTTPLSSPLQVPSPLSDATPAEESDEHIARLFEDMVMMGLNILPSVSEDKSNDINHRSRKRASPEPHSKMGQCEATAPCLVVCDHNLGPGGFHDAKRSALTVSSHQGEAGFQYSEKHSKFGSVELKDVSSVSSHSTFPITSACITSQKDSGAPVILQSSTSEKSLMSSIPFGSASLEVPSQNVGELKNVLDNLFWTTDHYVKSVKQTNDINGNYESLAAATSNVAQDSLDKGNTVLQTHSNADHSATGKQGSETESWRDKNLPKPFPHITHHTSILLHATTSDEGTNLSEMRLPRCLSPLVSKEGETESFNEERRQKVKSPFVSASAVTLTTGLKSKNSFPQPQPVPGNTSQQNTSCTHHYKKQHVATSLNEANEDCTEEKSKGQLGQDMRKRPILNNQICEGISTTQLGDENSKCKLTSFWKSKSHKSRDQDDFTRDMSDNHLTHDLDEHTAKSTHSAEHRDLQRAVNEIANGCEENATLEPTMKNASAGIKENTDDDNVTRNEAIQPNQQAVQAKGTSIIDQVFHQTIFSAGATVTSRFPPIDQQLKSSLCKTENSQTKEGKRKAGPSLPHIIKKLRKLTEKDNTRGRKLMDNSAQEQNTSAGKCETRVEVNDKIEEVLGLSQCINIDSTFIVSSEQLKLSSENTNECLVDGKTGTEADQVKYTGNSSIQPTLSSHLCTVPLVNTFGSKVEINQQCKSPKVSANKEVTSNQTEDFHLAESVKSHIWNQEVVDWNEEMEVGDVMDFQRGNEQQRVEINNIKVEMMEESAAMSAEGQGEEAGASLRPSEKTDKEERVSVAYSMEPRGQPSQMSSNEGDPPVITAKEALHTSICNETEAQNCDKEEDEFVDVVSSSPSDFPYSEPVRESSIFLIEEDVEMEEEEEEVDVTN